MSSQRIAEKTTRLTRLQGTDLGHAVTSPKPKDGILVLQGYGLRIAVERGHLVVSDGVGDDRRAGRFARATSGLRRLVILGHAGSVSLEALRWLHDVGVSFVHLDADGTVITISTPLGTDSPQLRRAQALAPSTGTGLTLARTLIAEKLARQEALLARFGSEERVVAEFTRAWQMLAEADTVEQIRLAESIGAAIYWANWARVEVRFTRQDEAKVPEHWRQFRSRSSPLANGPRLAADPVNALLNYLYGILEAETRMACLTVGLDPGLGVLHADQAARDSLALDLMEPVRPMVDELVLDLLAQHIFTAKDFFENVQGHCRLMPSITTALAEYALSIARWVAPYAEQAARAFANISPSTAKSNRRVPTPLTQANRRDGRDAMRVKDREAKQVLRSPLPTACKACGLILEDAGRTWCDDCYAEYRAEKDQQNIAIATAVQAQMRAEGRDPAHGGESARKRGATIAEHMRLNAEWEASNTSTMTEDEYRERVQPLLATMEVRKLAEVLGVSRGYAASVRNGTRMPHPRHWLSLLTLFDSTARKEA